MNETEWLSSTDPAAMLKRLMSGPGLKSGRVEARPSDRKLRLFDDACFALFGLNIDDVAVQANPVEGAAALLRDIFGNPFRPVRFDRACFTCNGRGEIPIKEPPYVHVMIPRFEQCHTCRGGGRIEWDRPGWLTTPTVRALALAAYTEQGDDGTLDPHRLSVLADAAEDAGLEDAEILNHLRGKELCTCLYGYGAPPNTPQCSDGWLKKRGPCVRGCHVLDLFLDKE